MIGSIDYTKWSWPQCPQAYRAQFSRGDSGSEPFILLEAVASQDKWGYYLSDGIYPEWAVLMKSISQPGTPAQSRNLKRITHLMYTCIILHNMIRKEKRKAISSNFYPEEQHREDDP
ncbi:ALP1-like protein, partial [Tanacetum coccineum]